MSDPLSEKLSRVACESLEQLAFLCPFPCGEGETPSGSDAGTVQLQFAGPFSGELFATLSSSALPELACNMLGLEADDELSIEQLHDAFREAVNVICGNLLPQVAGGQAVFDLKAPRLLEPGALPEALAGREPAAHASFELDEGGIELLLVLEAGWEKSVPPTDASRRACR